MRLFVFVAISWLLATITALGQRPDVPLTIWNTQNHDVVVGVYTPLNGGIEETLVAVPAYTAIEEVPIPLIANDQFAVAYKAKVVGGQLLRVKPLAIVGLGPLHVVNRDKNPYAILRYRRTLGLPISASRQFDSAKDERRADVIKKAYAHLLKATIRYQAKAD